MARPTPDSAYPYTRGDIVGLTGVSVTTIKSLMRGGVLKKRERGTGNYEAFDDEGVLRIMLSKELLRLGFQVAAIHSLFASLQRPTASTAKPWSWLDSDEARDQGAVLVLILTHRSMSSTTGAAMLSNLEAAKGFLGSRTAIVIDVNSFIREIEERTGRAFRLTRSSEIAKARKN